MMRIFVFVGTNNKVNSVSYYVMKKIIMMLKQLNSDLDFDTYFFRAGDVRIDTCKGCGTCFQKGMCVLDPKDDMHLIKEKMLSADIILFASPVYANHVTGIMKNFIDRLAYWLHLLELRGKKGGIFTITQQSGAEYVEQYLDSIMTCLGINTLYKRKFITGRLSSLEEMDNDIFQASKNLSDALQVQDLTSNNNEKYFSELKKIVVQAKLSGGNSVEIEYWYKTGMAYCDTLQECILQGKRI